MIVGGLFGAFVILLFQAHIEIDEEHPEESIDGIPWRPVGSHETKPFQVEKPWQEVDGDRMS
jgi:hypothetical protein